MVAIKELLKDHLLRPGLWMVALLLTGGVSLGAYLVNGGSMFSPGELSEKARTQSSVGGVTSHADLANNCAACHAPPIAGGTMADRCMQCHTNIRTQLDTHGPMHGRIDNAEQCRICHTEHKGAHANLTSFAGFQHDWTAFKLTGHHVKVECKSCHKSDVFQGTPQSCVACHAEPTVHKGRFGNNCIQCHTTETWVLTGGAGKSLVDFDHDATAFKLTGKHAKADCRQCHVKDTFKGTPNSCVSCHADPVVHRDRFGDNCAKCHSTSTWVLLNVDGKDLKNFDHDATGFKLTGKHAMTDCRQCHKNDTFKGTAKTCVSCHADPPVHKGRFGTACADCHTTSSWAGAVFKHTVFPISHHNKDNTCAKCHNNASNFVSYTCYNCHAHTPAKEAARGPHRKVASNLDTLANCIQCHDRNKKKKGGKLVEAEHLPGNAVSFTGCPAANDLAPLLAWTAPTKRVEVKTTSTLAAPPPALGKLNLESLLKINLPGSARWDAIK